MKKAVILMVAFKRTLCLILLLLVGAGTSFSQTSDSELIFGVVQQEGGTFQSDTPTYKASQLTIDYLNAYFKARKIDLQVYRKPQMGTYFETLDRLQKRKLDIVVLPSFTYLAAGSNVDFKLIGILDYPKPWRSLVVVRQDSGISNMGDLMNNSHKYKIAYINELSASGYVIPKIYFQETKMRFKDELFSEGHFASIQKLLKGEYGKDTVIVVDEVIFEGFKRAYPQQASVLNGIYAIENPLIFKDCIFAGANVSDNKVKLLKEAFDMENIKKIADSKLRDELTRIVDEVKKYIGFERIATDVNNKVFDYLNRYLGQYHFNFTERFPVDRVIEKIADDIQSRVALDPKYKPKVAVVLSGGGASGAYQAGVLKAIEEKLDEYNQQIRKNMRPVTIDLVVGTSIGAFNAVLFALGSTDELTRFYAEIKGKDLLTPYWKYRLMSNYTAHPFMMIFITVFFVYAFFSIAHFFAAYDLRRINVKNDLIPPLHLALIVALVTLINYKIAAELIFGLVLVSIGSLFIRILNALNGRLLGVLASRLGEKSSLYKATDLFLRFILVVMPVLIFSSIFMIVGRNSYFIMLPMLLTLLYLTVKSLSCNGNLFSISIENNIYFRGVESLGRLAFIISGFVILFFVMSFFKSGTAIFTSEGFERSYTKALAGYLGESGIRDKEDVSKMVMAKDIKREYLITSSDLRGNQEVYFYFHPWSMPEPYLPSGIAWVSLNKNPEKLVDALIGSASALVAFPLKNMQVGEMSLALTDGASLHHVPVDAANSLGATHLIIILCTEDTKKKSNPEEWNFFEYVYGSINFSIFGSQTLDYLSREKRMSFLVAPRERRIKKQEFDGTNYKGQHLSLKDFMQEGYDDAMGKENGFRELSAGEFVLK